MQLFDQHLGRLWEAEMISGTEALRLAQLGEISVYTVTLSKFQADLRRKHPTINAHRGNEVSGDYLMSVLGAGLDFDDPIDTFGQLFITEGGRWYQRRSIAELDELFDQQKSEGDFEKRRALVWEMDQIAMNDASFLILHWWQFNRIQWDFVKGLTSTASARTTNARMIYTWLDLPEANRTSK